MGRVAGTVLANDDCTKKLIIKNLSDVPLMYQIVKPRNWVSEEFMNFRDDEVPFWAQALDPRP